MANRCPEPSCVFFNRILPNNAKVCPMCGTPLGTVGESPAASISATQPSTARPQPPPPAKANSLRPQLKLSHPSGKDFYLSGEAGIVGRRDRSSDKAPEIDLSGIPDEGVISRSHARLFWDKSQHAYTIVDSSRNGSYLNGNLLTPGSSYRLNHGDELQLGQNQLVRLKISLVQPE
ncbi:FHA domain-containing protein [Chroococcidiopsis sp. SAG 2025]|uniref:FHA domain-containing protein n=1 Tax=Chroococcidiopsis sp. SAG 2025 TaxID=171389 RepID=UPI002936F4A8|nr:FHA domain-containing protein [Chroococcidiopsis sp. SAG 2025]